MTVLIQNYNKKIKTLHLFNMEVLKLLINAEQKQRIQGSPQNRLVLLSPCALLPNNLRGGMLQPSFFLTRSLKNRSHLFFICFHSRHPWPVLECSTHLLYLGPAQQLSFLPCPSFRGKEKHSAAQNENARPSKHQHFGFPTVLNRSITTAPLS